MSDLVNFKRCSRCNEEKELTKFPFRGNGFRGVCYSCVAIRAREQRHRWATREKKCEHCGRAFRTLSVGQKFCGYTCSNLGQPRGAKPVPPSERFWSRVQIAGEEDCWLWLGPIGTDGYARFDVKHGKKVLAHRFAYEDRVGPIPENLNLDHVAERGCVHRHCVNPNHLEPVTQAENARRGVGSKPTCINGHDFDEKNTRIDEQGHRLCRVCDREKKRKQNPWRPWRRKNHALVVQRSSACEWPDCYPQGAHVHHLFGRGHEPLSSHYAMCVHLCVEHHSAIHGPSNPIREMLRWQGLGHLIEVLALDKKELPFTVDIPAGYSPVDAARYLERFVGDDQIYESVYNRSPDNEQQHND